MAKFKVGDIVRLDDAAAAVRLKRNPDDFYANKSFVVVEVNNINDSYWVRMRLSPDPENVGCNWVMRRFVLGGGPW